MTGREFIASVVQKRMQPFAKVRVYPAKKLGESYFLNLDDTVPDPEVNDVSIYIADFL